MSSNKPTTYPLGLTASFWGIIGFYLLIGNALAHLTKMSFDALQSSLTPLQWTLLIANIIFMAYTEGYKGFQKNYSPRLAARALYLTRSRSPMELLLAPLFCMMFFNAPPKRIFVSFALLVMIVIVIMLFRLLPQPWRGILDAGVVVGLLWGGISTSWFCFRAFTDPSFAVDPEILNTPHIKS